MNGWLVRLYLLLPLLAAPALILLYGILRLLLTKSTLCVYCLAQKKLNKMTMSMFWPALFESPFFTWLDFVRDICMVLCHEIALCFVASTIVSSLFYHIVTRMCDDGIQNICTNLNANHGRLFKNTCKNRMRFYNTGWRRLAGYLITTC